MINKDSLKARTNNIVKKLNINQIIVKPFFTIDIFLIFEKREYNKL